jgi:hypothetical protein
MAKPLEEWTVEELRVQLARVGDELARRAAAPAAGKRPKVDVVAACEHWVRGFAWDETFTREMVEDERLVGLWLALRGERAARAA